MESQSLFHQVCVRSPRAGIFFALSSRNPFFIRSVFVLYPSSRNLQRAGRSQSLFHQVCVRSWKEEMLERFDAVAIPFSSGLCSFYVWLSITRLY